jgi:uncharacterized repeat protein (TIGR02543 family)
MNDDKNVTATFSEIPATKFNLTTTVTGNGKVTLNPDGGKYDEGTSVELTANPDEGSQFDGWGEDGSGQSNPLTIVMNDDKNVTATFSEIPATKFNLTTTVTGNGKVALNPDGGKYDEGTSVELTANPDEGSQFDGWGEDGSGQSNSFTIVMNDNKNVTATFSKIPVTKFNLTTSVNGNGNVTLNPVGGTYDSGSTIKLTAIPDEGWQFDGWGEDGSGQSNPLTIIMDGNKSVEARFIESTQLSNFKN